MKHNYTVTGERKKVNHGLVDYIADGYIDRNGEKIPCKVGFMTTYANENDAYNDVTATHIFITGGITESGAEYEAETIEL